MFKSCGRRLAARQIARLDGLRRQLRDAAHRQRNAGSPTDLADCDYLNPIKSDFNYGITVDCQAARSHAPPRLVYAVV